MTSPTNAPLVVLITGASSGIGRALARRLAQDGHSLALHARSAAGSSGERLAALEEECVALGAARVLRVFAELGSPDAAEHLVDATVSGLGTLDQIVNNAGFARQGGVADTSWQDLEIAFAVMPFTYARLIRLGLPWLTRSRRPRILGISSFVAHRFDATTPFFAAAAAKSAIEAMSQSAAAELAHLSITVNCIAPGFTQKDAGREPVNALAWSNAAAATPRGRVARPDEIAAVARFILGADADHITGQIIRVDGGLTLGGRIARLEDGSASGEC